MRKVVDVHTLPPAGTFVDTGNSDTVTPQMRCFVCDAKAPIGTPGWDRDLSRELCPKHRRSRPKALATFGELVQAAAEKRR